MGSPDAICPLPQHLVEEILLKLPVKSLLRFKAVCKHFNSLISSADFITRHHHNSQTNPSSIFLADSTIFRCNNLATSDAPLLEKLDQPSWDQMGEPFRLRTLVGYGNGLFCFRASSGFWYDKGAIFILWNPATKQFKSIRSLWIKAAIGFGYHSGIQEYKLFGIAGPNCLYVLSLRRGTWREIQTSDRRLEYSWQNENSSAVVVDGVWYRIIMDNTVGMRRILSFDLKEESIAWIDYPPLHPDHRTCFSISLGVHYKKLCFFVADRRRQVPAGSHHLDMWVMKGKPSWTKMLTTDLVTTDAPVTDYVRLGGSVRGSRVLLNAYSMLDLEYLRRYFLYDLSTNSWKEIPARNSGVRRLDEVHDYVESLVSPEVVFKCLDEIRYYVASSDSSGIVGWFRSSRT